MITAAEAVRLPSAQLTTEETRAADVLEAELDQHVRQHMTRTGVHFDTRESRAAVLTEVLHRARRAGWQVHTLAVEEPSPLFASKNRVVGYRLILAPSEDACTASDIIASA